MLAMFVSTKMIKFLYYKCILHYTVGTKYKLEVNIRYAHAT